MSVGRDGASDAVAFQKAGVPAVEFGPSGGGHHGPDEWVSIDSLARYRRALVDFAPQRPRAASPTARRGGRAGVKKDGVPRPGRGVLLRALIAGVLTIALSATAVASAVLLEIDDVVETFIGGDEGRTVARHPGGHRAEAGDPRTFLILGSDARYGDHKLGIKPRSDTILLARVDPDTKRIAVMSLPRDLKVKIPGAGTGKINSAYEIGGPRKTVVDDQAAVRGRDGRGLPDQQRDQRQLRRLPARGQLRRRRLRRRRPPLLQRQHDGGARRGLRDDRHPARLPEAQGPGRARLRPLPPRRQRLLPRHAPAGLPAPDRASGRRPRSCWTRASARSSRASSAATSRSTSPS